MTTVQKYRIRFFAYLREKANREYQNIELSATTPEGVWQHLEKSYGFDLDPKCLAVAVNGNFAEWNYRLKPNDELAFMPPMSGG